MTRAHELAQTMRDPIAREAVRQLARPAPHLTDPEARALCAELERMVADAERLREALAFYATTYTGGIGDPARAALGAAA